MPNIVTPLHRSITTTPDTPCPPWCVLPTGHGLDEVDCDGSVMRAHRSAEQVVGGYRLQVEQSEFFDTAGQLLEARPPELRMLPAEPGPDHDVLTLADAGELAAGMFWLVAGILDASQAQR